MRYTEDKGAVLWDDAELQDRMSAPVCCGMRRLGLRETYGGGPGGSGHGSADVVTVFMYLLYD